MDVLSDVLRVVRLSGAVFFTADFSSPWALESPVPDQLAAAVMPDADCVVLFHILVEGECEVACQAHPVAVMQSGDVIVFPRGDQHTMRSHGAARRVRWNRSSRRLGVTSLRSCRTGVVESRHVSCAGI